MKQDLLVNLHGLTAVQQSFLTFEWKEEFLFFSIEDVFLKDKMYKLGLSFDLKV